MKLILLLFIVFLSPILFAQTPDLTAEFDNSRFSLSIGPTFPIGSFANITDGAAKTGIGVSADLSIGSTPSWFSTLNISYNGVSNGALGVPQGVSVSYGPWWTIWPMSGMKLQWDVSQITTFYVAGQIGLLIGVSPGVSVSSSGGSATISSDAGVTFAAGLGGGVVINNQFIVGAKYLYGKPEYDLKIVDVGVSNTAHVQQSTSIIMLTLGLKL